MLKNYQDLNKEHISDKRFLQSLDENQFSHEERILYDRVHQFFKDIEEHANLYYGFRLGTFYLSSSYFRVLESIFPSTSSSTPDSIHSANNKEELWKKAKLRLSIENNVIYICLTHMTVLNKSLFRSFKIMTCWIHISLGIF